jgi:hypothetical protein
MKKMKYQDYDDNSLEIIMDVTPANLSYYMLQKGSCVDSIKKAAALVEKDISSKGNIFKILDEYNREFKLKSDDCENKYAFFFFVRHEKKLNIPQQEIFDFYDSKTHEVDESILQDIKEFMESVERKKRSREEELPANKRQKKYKLLDLFETNLYNEGKKETTVTAYKCKVRNILKNRKVDTLKRLRKVQKSEKSKCTPLTSFYKFCKSLDDSECTFEAIEDEKENNDNNSDDGNSDSDSDEEDDNNSESEVQEVISDNEEEQVVESDEEDNDKESEENSKSYKRSTRSGKSVATPFTCQDPYERSKISMRFVKGVK